MVTSTPQNFQFRIVKAGDEVRKDHLEGRTEQALRVVQSTEVWRDCADAEVVWVSEVMTQIADGKFPVGCWKTAGQELIRTGRKVKKVKPLPEDKREGLNLHYRTCYGLVLEPDGVQKWKCGGYRECMVKDGSWIEKEQTFPVEVDCCVIVYQPAEAKVIPRGSEGLAEEDVLRGRDVSELADAFVVIEDDRKLLDEEVGGP